MKVLAFTVLMSFDIALSLVDDAAPFWATFTNTTEDGIIRQDRIYYIATATPQNEATGGWEKMPFVLGGLTVGTYSSQLFSVASDHALTTGS